MRTCILFLSICLLILASCRKKEDHHRNGKEAVATVIRDCSGDYLRIENSDYLICNKESVIYMSDSALINVKYHSTPECYPVYESSYLCDIYHPYVEVVTVTEAVRK